MRAAELEHLAGSMDGPAALAGPVRAVLDALAEGARERGGPVPPGHPRDVEQRVAAALGDVLPPVPGDPPEAVVHDLTRLLAAGAADPANPRCAAHLHCPPLAVAVAAEVAVAALNQSLDSWDQAPAATTLEPLVARALAGLTGYDPDEAGGVITSGGTESNLMGLLLARDAGVRRVFGADVARDGIADARGRLRVLCSEVAHFSVQRSAAVLGLGEDAVVPVPVDSAYRMRPVALEVLCDGMRRAGVVPIAVVATAGTTDFGSIDPLPEIADAARAHGIWLHVDAAYGGGALFSDRLAGLLEGIEAADSVAIDLHKLGWQPIPAGVFLTRDRAAFEPLARTVSYLNPADDEQAGYPSLLGYSLRTTRRVDAFKIAVTLRAYGRAGLGRLVDACHDLAEHAARRIAADDRLELAAPPVLASVVFRYTARTDRDRVNAALRRGLLAEGRAVVGRTDLDGAAGDRVWLKLTLLNPYATADGIDALLDDVAEAGEKEDR